MRGQRPGNGDRRGYQHVVCQERNIFDNNNSIHDTAVGIKSGPPKPQPQINYCVEERGFQRCGCNVGWGAYRQFTAKRYPPVSWWPGHPGISKTGMLAAESAGKDEDVVVA